MSEGRNESFENMVLFLVVGGLIVGGILYALFALWPYLVFYVLPVVMGSFLVCGILRLSIQPTADKGFAGLYQYKNLAIAFAVVIAVVYLVFYAGSERHTQVDKKGNEIAHILEWPSVHHAFNDLRRESYGGSFFSSLKEAASHEVMYDRQELGFLAWLCLFLFGPMLFWYYSKDDFDRDKDILFQMVNEHTRYREDEFKQKSKNLDKIILEKTSVLEKRVADLEKAKREVLAENQVLKAKLEFSSEVVRPSESVKSDGGGLLDQGIL